jgi:hypothetical protein
MWEQIKFGKCLIFHYGIFLPMFYLTSYDKNIVPYLLKARSLEPERLWNNIRFWATAGKQTTEQRPLLGSRFLISYIRTETKNGVFHGGQCRGVIQRARVPHPFTLHLRTPFSTVIGGCCEPPCLLVSGNRLRNFVKLFSKMKFVAASR